MARVRPRRLLAFPGLGRVARVLDAPSCSVLELEDGTLVPFISDADRARRPRRPREIEVERRTSSDEDRRLHAVPGLVRLVRRAAPRAQRPRARPRLDSVDLRATTPLKAGQVDDTPYGGGAGMVIRVDVVEAALRGALRARRRRRTGRSPCRPGGASSTTPSPPSWPPSPRSRCCAGATRASTSA